MIQIAHSHSRVAFLQIEFQDTFNQTRRYVAASRKPGRNSLCNNLNKYKFVNNFNKCGRNPRKYSLCAGNRPDR